MMLPRQLYFDIEQVCPNFEVLDIFFLITVIYHYSYRAFLSFYDRGDGGFPPSPFLDFKNITVMIMKLRGYKKGPKNLWWKQHGMMTLYLVAIISCYPNSHHIESAILEFLGFFFPKRQKTIQK